MSSAIPDMGVRPARARQHAIVAPPAIATDRLSPMLEAASTLAGALDSPSLFERLVEIAPRLFEASGCAWLFWDAKDTAFRLGPVAAGSGNSAGPLQPGDQRVWPSSSPQDFSTPLILRCRSPAQSWPVAARPLKRFLQRLHADSILIAPLWQDPELVGILVISRSRGMPPFDAEAVRLASILLAQTGVVLRCIQRLEDLERYAMRLTLTQRISLSVAANLDESAICHAVVKVLAHEFGYSHCSLYLIRGEELILEAQGGAAGPDAAPERLALDQGAIAFTVRSGRALFLSGSEGAASEADLSAVLPGGGVRALVPLRQGQRVLGLLMVESPVQGPPLEEADVRLLETVAMPIAAALEKARLYQQEQRWSRKLHAINELGRRLSSILTRDALLERTAESLARAFEFDQVGVYLTEKLPSPASACLLWVVEHGQSLALSASDESPPGRLAPAAGVGYELAIPIRLADQVIGVIDVQSKQPRAFGEDDIALLESLAGQVAVAIENARLYEQIRSSASLLEDIVAARTRHLSTLHAVTAAVSYWLDLNAIAEDTVNQVRRLLRLPGAAFYVTEPIEAEATAPVKTLRCIASHGIADGAARAAQAAAEQATAGREPVWLAPLECDPVMAVPLVAPDECLGALVVAGRLTREDCDVLIAVGRELGVAVHNARLYAAVSRYAEELKTSQRRLIESERLAAMGKLAAAIAHEINNPLQAIQTHLGLALEEAAAGEPVDLDNLRIAADEIQRTGQLIHQFLDFYRPATGEAAIVDLDIVLDEVLKLVEQKLHQVGVRLVRQRAPARADVRAHAAQLKQVFLNLLLNAIDAMPGGGQIEICTEVQSGQALVHVADTGHGIPPEVMPHLFEPFFTTKSRGIGMGLFVSQGIIHNYGGEMQVASEPGRGTTFTVALPCNNA